MGSRSTLHKALQEPMLRSTNFFCCFFCFISVLFVCLLVFSCKNMTLFFVFIIKLQVGVKIL